MIEIINHNEEGFQHFILLPTIQFISERFYDRWENSIGISFLNFSIYFIWNS